MPSSIELFNTIIRGCNSDEKLKSTLSRIGSTLKKYSDFIKLPKFNLYGTEIDINDTVQGAGKALGTFLEEEPSLEEQKEKTNQVLRQLEKPLVIFIDDVDRLDKEEVRLLFKTIKLTADFDKIIYKLAFDEEIVSKSLGGFYGSGKEEDGKRFIEKIVQLPIRIPELNTEIKLQYTLSLLKEWETRSKVTLPNIDKERFINKLKIIHSLFIETPRDSKRLINAFSFVEKSLRGEVNAWDLILIESLRLFTPMLFQLIVNKKDLLFDTFDNEKINISVDVDSAEIPLGKQSKVLLILDWILPFHNFVFTDGPKSIHDLPLDYYDSQDYSEQRKKNLTKYLNIGSRPYFLKYIEFNIGQDQIPDVSFKEVLHVFNESTFQESERKLNKLSAFSPDIIYNKFEIFEEQLNDIGKSNLIQILFLNPIYKNSFNFERYFIGSSRSSYAISVKSVTYFNSFKDNALLKNTLFNILNTSTDIHGLSQLVLLCKQGFQNNFGDTIKLEKIEVVDSQISSFIQKVIDIPVEEYYKNVDEKKNGTLFSLLELSEKGGELRQKISDLILKESIYSIAHLKSFSDMVSVDNFATSSYSIEISNSAFIKAELYVSRDILVQGCNNVFPGIDLNYTIADNFASDERRSADESVVTQYLRFVKREQSKQ